MAAATYRVSAPYVTARVIDVAGKEAVVGFHRDQLLPASTLEASVTPLLAKGMIEAVPAAHAAEEPTAPPADDAEAKPAKATKAAKAAEAPGE